ncbi:MAG TPA: phytanoyl-CoA dioxygenase family protein [Candidatus Binataceae bacterium]|nr:phytanoyl-CoA dioxygenase family protein [Candidatus Binataceae bacterium]
MLSDAHKEQWGYDGFFIKRGFESPLRCRALHDRVVEIARTAATGTRVPNVLLVREKKPNPYARNPEDAVAKIFRLHRDGPFEALVTDPRYVAIAQELLDPEIDCFVTQFIFKNRGAMGQPWHQDSHYFAFSKSPQVGFWLAITPATRDNGCLYVLPGSHREPVHKHVPDTRTHALYGYEEIVDYDPSASTPVLMDTGDLLVFHSHLMHRSTDNDSAGIRAAMVWHYAAAGTEDHTKEKFGFQNPSHDFMPVARRA